MKQQLIAMQPTLKKSQIETAQLMEKVQAKLPGVKKIRSSVQKEAAKAQAEADVCAGMKAECEADLAEAMPILNDAIKALKTISKDDINEIRGLKTPPSGVILVMKAVCTYTFFEFSFSVSLPLFHTHTHTHTHTQVRCLKSNQTR